jgi:hypothetical protein
VNLLEEGADVSISTLALVRRAIGSCPSRWMRAARRRVHGLVAVGAAVPVLAGLAAAPGAAPALASASMPQAQAQVPVPVHPSAQGRQRLVVPAMRPEAVPRVSWPAAGTAEVTLRA